MDQASAPEALSESHQDRIEPDAVVRPRRTHPTLFELRMGQCRFPLGSFKEPARFFCGQPVLAPRSYCPECCKRAYVPAKPKR
jgi:hypothetical protein